VGCYGVHEEAHDLAGEAEAAAGALFLLGEEGHEDLAQGFINDPQAIISDLNSKTTLVFETDSQPESGRDWLSIA